MAPFINWVEKISKLLYKYKTIFGGHKKVVHQGLSVLSKSQQKVDRIPDDSLWHGQGRVSTDNDSISRIEDVCGNSSLISEESVTDQGITFGTGMCLDPQVADAGQIGLATLGSLAPD